MNQLKELKAETNNGTFSIGNFRNKNEALKVAVEDKNSESGIYCLSGKVEYVYDEEVIL